MDPRIIGILWVNCILKVIKHDCKIVLNTIWAFAQFLGIVLILSIPIFLSGIIWLNNILLFNTESFVVIPFILIPIMFGVSLYLNFVFADLILDHDLDMNNAIPAYVICNGINLILVGLVLISNISVLIIGGLSICVILYAIHVRNKCKK